MLNHLNQYLLFVLFVFLQAQAVGQNLSITTNETVCYDPNQPLILSNFSTLEGDDNEVIEGLQIAIVNNLQADDVLAYNGGGSISGSYDSTVGILELIGTATLAQYRDALGDVTFTTETPELSKSINITISGVDFLYDTGHFYQFFSSPGISWSDAKAASASKELYGLQGYLTTITTTSENNFILNRVSGTAWIGATDEAVEGAWRWTTGPEGLANNGQGVLLTQGFQNWDSGAGEPNDCCSGANGEENYAHMMDWSTPAGLWNDLPDAGGSGQYATTGYIVEYGGMPGEPNVLEDLSSTIILESTNEISIEGATSVCPNIQGVTYTADSYANHDYEWTVSGGILASGQGTASIVVNWGDTNPTASVSLQVNSAIACTYDLTLNIKINEQLEPPLPIGSENVCYLEIPNEQTYRTPLTAGSDYEWKITNGQIVNGQGTNEVQVLWDEPGVGEIYFTESTSTATDICAGDSPVLIVDIKNEISPELVIQDVSCFGGNDGSARIVSVNGSNVFDVNWVTLGAGSVNENEVTGLRAGTYSAEIWYEGCVISIPVIIEQPEELTGTITKTDALCFGASNGTALAEVTGGTGAYTYVWSHNQNSSGAFVSNVPFGSHSVDIRDENNCLLTITFDIHEPEPLLIDSIASQKVSCPELSDGILEAFVGGGTPPYSFSWSQNTSVNALAVDFAQGEYQVLVTDANGCTVSGSQIVEEAVPMIVLPNAFSPNGDGNNETFRPANSCPIQYQLTVYSRWGSVLFHTNDITLGWDGTFEGSPAPEGKYSYFASWVIEANDVRVADEVRGEFRLIR